VNDSAQRAYQPGCPNCSRAARVTQYNDNHVMQTLRNAHYLARLALVWFALYLGAAVASTFLVSPGLGAVCSATAVSADAFSGGASPPASPKMAIDCPLCAPSVGLPPPALSLNEAPAQPLAYATWPIPAARVAALTAAPLPARGPPEFS